MSKKNTKRALLSSVLCLVLCLAMLTGTTFAWFTDSVTSGVNKIVAGNLDVELYHTNSYITDEKVDGLTDLFTVEEGKTVLWEPGVMVWEKFTVVNAGDLALKYQLAVNFENEVIVNGHGLSEVLKVAVMDVQPTRENIAAAQLMDMDDFLLSEDNTLLAGAEESFYVAIYWQPTDHDNDYNMNNGSTDTLSIDLGVYLKAMQVDFENDSFGNDYDAGLDMNATYVASAEGLYNALMSNGNIKLSGDIDMAGFNWTQVDTFTGVLDGNGYAIKNYTSTGAMIAKLDGGTIKNLSVENAEVTSASGNYVAVLVGQTAKTTNKSVIDNVTVSGTVTASNGSYYVGGIVGAERAYDCVITNCTNYADVTGGQSVGGICGYTTRNLLMEGCVNYGDITGSVLVGGMVGFVALDEGNDTLCTTINNCANYGTATATSTAFPQFVGSNGGIVGNVGRSSGDATTKMMSAYINNCMVMDGQSIYGTAGNYAPPSSGPEAMINVVVNGSVSLQQLADGAYYDGADTYYITNANGMKWFADEVNAPEKPEYEGNTFAGKTVLLMNDIDLEGAEWNPIGNFGFSSKKFAGTFDGQGHTVSNFKITQKTADKAGKNRSPHGFFGNVDGTIMNLTVANASLTVLDDGRYAGLLVGRLNGGLIKNCHVINSYAEVDYWQIGGLVGQAQSGIIDSCSVVNTTIAAPAAVGAIVGYQQEAKEVTIKNCLVDGCTIEQKDSFGANYDPMFGAVIGAIKNGNATLIMNGCTVENTTVKGVVSNTLYGCKGDGDKVYIDNANVDGNATTTYAPTASSASLQEALNSLDRGDTLVLPAGTYTVSGTHTLPDGVTVMAAEGAEVIFRVTSTYDNIFNCEGDAVIKNITMITNLKGYCITDASKNHDTDGNITVIGCKFYGTEGVNKCYGVYKNKYGDLNLIDCYFDGNTLAIGVCGLNNAGDSQTTITGCVFEGFTAAKPNAIDYVGASVSSTFVADVIAANTGLTADNMTCW